MKKVFIVLLLLVHTLASSGVVLSTHYCMGDFAGISIGATEEDGCGTCGMKGSDCCHDAVAILKVDHTDIQQVRGIEFFYASTVPQVFIPIVPVHFTDLPLCPLHLGGVSSPPIYLVNRNFRI
ncbi:MAG: hypothetical protein FJX83_02965 [Bacteroidetes bacterium]|nr:hypothetical protein [Bacteroidota bacterium]